MHINKIVSLAILLSLGVFSFVAISAQGATAPSISPSPQDDSTKSTSRSTFPFCGNNVCDSGETYASCPADCAATPLVCPADGVEFAPRNPNFLSLVGNELQIAIYYNANFSYLAQKYAEAGVKNVRLILNWENIESTNNSFNWNYVDYLVGAFAPQGVNPVGIISKTPQWASSCPGNQYYFNCIAANMDDYRDFVRTAVRRYGPAGTNTIHDWEIRVEALPNHQVLTKEQYVQELNVAYATIKQEDPNARVWGPEVAFVSNNGTVSSSQEVYDWIDYTIQNGSFDVFSVHQLGPTTPAVARTHTARVRSRLNAAGKQNIPLAVTATTLTNPAGTQQAQAQNLRDMYTCISSAGADYAFWFAGTEWALDVNLILNDVTHGIFDYNFTVPENVRPKLAYYALKELGDSIEENTPPPAVLPTATLSASPNPVDSGNNTTLSWGSTHATSCSVISGSGSGFAITGSATSGNDSSENLTTATTFAIRCTGAGGSATASVTVNVSEGSGGGGGGGGGGTGSTTTANLQAQITALLAQIAALQAQLGIIPSPGGSSFTRDLMIGSQGEDVRRLQIYLNTHGSIVATFGPGSRGSETATFGPATRAALIRFQAASNIFPASGYFGPKTRAYVSARP